MLKKIRWLKFDKTISWRKPTSSSLVSLYDHDQLFFISFHIVSIIHGSFATESLNHQCLKSIRITVCISNLWINIYCQLHSIFYPHTYQLIICVLFTCSIHCYSGHICISFTHSEWGLSELKLPSLGVYQKVELLAHRTSFLRKWQTFSEAI